ncbi:hypothetical protein [Pontiella sp.]|uniref:hypothetical protein n=1 Tax=Pontiella sp. TaxID=2837462 RepID=UPI00356B4563
MNKQNMLLGVVLAMAASAFARPFSAAEIPANSKWVAYANATGIRDSQIGQYIVAEIDEKAQRKLDGIKAIFNFDPLQDVDSILAFGPTIEEHGSGVMMISGTFDEAHLTTLLKMNKTYAQTTHNGTVIHNWVDDKNKQKDPAKRVYGAFASNGDIVMGDNEALVAQAIDVLAGKAPCLSGDSALNLAELDNAAFVAAALEVGDGEMLPAKAALLRQTRSMYFSLQESDGKLLAQLEINTDNSEAAFYVDSIVRGMLGMAFLHDETNPGLARLARGVRVNTIDQRVVIESACPVELVTETLQKSRGKSRK